MAEFIVSNEQDIRNLTRLLLGLNEQTLAAVATQFPNAFFCVCWTFVKQSRVVQ